MAPKSTAVFTECLSNTAPLQASLDVLEPIEKKIANFFDKISQCEKIPASEISDIKTLLANPDPDNLLPPEELALLNKKSKSLQRQLIFIEGAQYFLKFPEFIKIIAAYRNLIKLNQDVFSVTQATNVLSRGDKNLPMISAEDIQKVQKRLDAIEELITPLEKEKPLSMELPLFESDVDVMTYMKESIQRRVEWVEELNYVREELRSVVRGFEDTGLRERGLGLLDRVLAIHDSFSRIPGLQREEAVVTVPGVRGQEEFSLKAR